MSNPPIDPWIWDGTCAATAAWDGGTNPDGRSPKVGAKPLRFALRALAEGAPPEMRIQVSTLADVACDERATLSRLPPNVRVRYFARELRRLSYSPRLTPLPGTPAAPERPADVAAFRTDLLELSRALDGLPPYGVRD